MRWARAPLGRPYIGKDARDLLAARRCKRDEANVTTLRRDQIEAIENERVKMNV